MSFSKWNAEYIVKILEGYYKNSPFMFRKRTYLYDNIKKYQDEIILSQKAILVVIMNSQFSDSLCDFMMTNLLDINLEIYITKTITERKKSVNSSTFKFYLFIMNYFKKINYIRQYPKKVFDPLCED
jgi:hypothetical protein